MSRDQFIKGFSVKETRAAAWASCHRGDWMYGAALWRTLQMDGHHAALLRHLFADLMAEARVQTFDSRDAQGVLEAWLSSPEDVAGLRRFAHELSAVSNQAILADHPAHGALADSFVKAACVCEALCEEPPSVACGYIEEAAECLAVARALAAGSEDPMEAATQMAQGLRSRFDLS
ncbi:MAG: hypothetical protein KUG77_19555 [Nannocystaceae bacterium]|nr:hypothetical protein [Nannocystaceae bacterium]